MTEIIIGTQISFQRSQDFTPRKRKKKGGGRMYKGGECFLENE